MTEKNTSQCFCKNKNCFQIVLCYVAPQSIFAEVWNICKWYNCLAIGQTDKFCPLFKCHTKVISNDLWPFGIQIGVCPKNETKAKQNPDHFVGANVVIDWKELEDMLTK